MRSLFPLSPAKSGERGNAARTEQSAAPSSCNSVRADAPQTAAAMTKSIPQVDNSRGLAALALPMDDICPPFRDVARERAVIVHPPESHPCLHATRAGRASLLNNSKPA